MTFQQAIAKQEGFGVPGARPTVNHNPGDIIAGSFANLYGAIPGSGFIAVFPDDAHGWAALTALLKRPSYINLTVEQAIYQWLGLKPGSKPVDAVGDNAAIYVKDVCQWCNCQPTTPIKSLLGA